MLAGEKDGELREKVRARLETFVANLRARLAAEPDEVWLRGLLAEEWRGSAETVLEVVEALRTGWIVGEDAAPAP